MADLNNEWIRIEKHTTFYAVAYTNFLHVERLAGERTRYEKARKREGRRLTEEDRDFLTVNRAAEERAAVVTVIFSALTLEAFINDYGIASFSKSFFENYLDKLDPVSKWVIVPWLRKGTTMNRGAQAFERLAKLFRLRNRLVHFKSTRKRARDLTEDDRISKKHASEAVRAVREAVSQLGALDEGVDTLWIPEGEKALETQ